MLFYRYFLKASLEHEKPPPVPKCSAAGFEDFDSFEGDCYLWMEEAKPFDDAEAECKKKGANLASIHDIGAELFALNKIKANDAWIGLSNKKVNSVN